MSKEKSKSTKTATLDRESIAAIVDEVELRLRQPAAIEIPQEPKMHGTKAIFFWGAASGLALAVAAPLLSKQAKPMVRGAIKGGILASRYVQKTASGFKEDVQDIAAEAKADLDLEQNPPHKD